MYLRKSDGGDIMAKWIDTLLDLKEEVEVTYNMETACTFLSNVLEFINTGNKVDTGDEKFDLLVRIAGLYLNDEQYIHGEMI